MATAWLVITAYCLSQIYSALIYGSIHGHRGGTFTLQEQSLGYIMSFLVTFIVTIYLLFIMFHKIDTLVKKHGGSYNKNTMIQVFKSALK